MAVILLLVHNDSRCLGFLHMFPTGNEGDCIFYRHSAYMYYASWPVSTPVQIQYMFASSVWNFWLQIADAKAKLVSSWDTDSLSSSQNIICRTKRSWLCHNRSCWWYGSIKLLGAIMVVDWSNWEMASLVASFFVFHDFSEELLRNKMELFILRIIFRL